MSIRSRKVMFLGSRAWPVRRAHKLTANQIYARYPYAEEREMSSSVSKQYSTTTIINCKIYWVPFGFQAYMETAYCQKRKQIDLKVKDIYRII
jgi:hypothetical protein